MIFIANVLVMNGGTTFLIRICREMQSRGVPCAVLLLRDCFDPNLLEDLRKHAAVIHLKDCLRDRAILFRHHLGIFGAIDWDRLHDSLRGYGNVIHAMSVFGLIFALRLNRRSQKFQTTVGVYHQNEFLYKSQSFYFAQEVIRIFGTTPPENVVFFNESSQSNYSKFFGIDYNASTVVPIGISLDPSRAKLSGLTGHRIVSVGNLFAFKTYNRHIVETVDRLRERFPRIRYDIYGAGPEEGTLRSLISSLALDDRIRLLGTLPYDEFRRVVGEANLFVGSGTALIEAAALGVPALIGVESQQAPETYGFLSDIKGFSYNENMAGVPKRPISDLVEKLFSDPECCAATAEACALKAQEFSIARTVDGFLCLSGKAMPIHEAPTSRALLRMLLSLVGMAVAERLGGKRPFRDRRDQSY